MKNQQKMEIHDYKRVLIDMLSFLHKICIENNIHYCLAYGSLIGAVRHNGFIPWDDDIDIWMDGQDYIKFKKIVATSTDYYILDAKDTPNYYNLMCRLCAKAGILHLKGVIDIDNLGPFIDIFQLHKAPTDSEERHKYYKEIISINRTIRHNLPLRYYSTLPFKRKIKMIAGVPLQIKNRLFVGTQKLKEERDHLISRYDNSESDLYYSVSEAKCSDKILFCHDTIKAVTIHDFENIQANIPQQYDLILKKIFGDYMKLPPEEERISRHHFVPYWR